MFKILYKVSFLLKYKDKLIVMGSSGWHILDPKDSVHHGPTCSVLPSHSGLLKVSGIYYAFLSHTVFLLLR